MKMIVKQEIKNDNVRETSFADIHLLSGARIG